MESRHGQMANHHRVRDQQGYVVYHSRYESRDAGSTVALSRADTWYNAENITLLEPYCSEFLIHAADAEGLQAGIDERLVKYLAEICSIPVTYAGGGRNIADLELVERLSDGKVDLTIGSALDIFGGKTVTFDECIEWNKARRA